MLKFCKFPHVGADQNWNFASYEWSFVFWRILNLRGRCRSKILTKLRHLAQKICHFRHNWPNTAVNCPTRRAYDLTSKRKSRDLGHYPGYGFQNPPVPHLYPTRTPLAEICGRSYPTRTPPVPQPYPNWVFSIEPVRASFF